MPRKTSTVSDSELVARVIARDDHAAFAELVARNQSKVRGFLRRLTLGDAGRADDLAQEAFLKGYRLIGTLRNTARFSPWLKTIAYQLFVDSYRRRQRRVVQVQAEEFFDSTPSAERALDAERNVLWLLEGLRKSEREVILMHYQAEMTHAEIAEAMDLPLGTVKSLLRRGRQKLETRQQIREGGDEACTRETVQKESA